MRAQKLDLVRPASNTGNDDDRRAFWLLSDYKDARWVVCDTRDQTRKATIDFRYTMPGGRDLTQFPRLYRTVKEYCWWVRSGGVTAIDDCNTHGSTARSIMALAHRLVLDNIFSFADLTPFDVEKIVADAQYGLDALLKVSVRLETFLGISVLIHRTGQDPFQSLRGTRSWGNPKNVSRIDVLSCCDLPGSASGVGSSTRLMDSYATELGISKVYKVRKERPTRVVAKWHMLRLIQPLEYLYVMRGLIAADTIEYAPFPMGASKLAKTRGADTTRTPTPPPRLALSLLEAAVKAVGAYDLEQVERLDQKDVAIACWIIIAAFSARRYEELASLQTNCVHGEEKTGQWLRIYIAKTTQKEEFIPIPPLVAVAVAVMVRLGEPDRRAEPGETRLFVKRRPNGDVVPMDLARSLDGFAFRHGVSAPDPFRDDSGETWHWHPHQFRRFFAMLFFYRHEGATLEALAHHLRHFDLEMTRRYVTADPEAASLWLDTEWQHLGDLAHRIVSGDFKTTGAMSDRLKKAYRRIVDKLRTRVRVQTQDRAVSALKLIMQREGLVIRPKSWVDCTCPRTAKAAMMAACRDPLDVSNGAQGPDFSAAGPTVCGAGCPWAIISQKTVDALEAEAVGLLNTTERGALPEGVFKMWAEARLATIQSLVDSTKTKLLE